MDNWLINVLALVLLCVVLDGARRAYMKHRESMKVSRNLSRSMRADLDFEDEDALSSPRPAAATKRKPRSESAVAPRKTQRDKKPKASTAAEAELEYIDPEEAEKRRQIAAELPGSVRVVQRRKPEDASQVNRKVQQNFQSSRKPLAGSKPVRNESMNKSPEESVETADRGPSIGASGASPNEPQQASLNLEEQVPTLMDSVVEEAGAPFAAAASSELSAQSTAEPDTSPFDRDFSAGAVSSETVSFKSGASDIPGEESNPASTHSSSDTEPAVAAMDPVTESIAEDRREPSLDESVSLESLQQVPDSAREQDDSRAETEAFPDDGETKSHSGWASADLKLPEFKLPEFKSRATREADKSVSDSKASDRKPGKQKSRGRKTSSRGAARDRSVEEVLILNIMAPVGDYFEGNDLLRVLLSGGLRFGDMNIFHYHCGEAGEGPVLFSLANIVVPGTFDMSAMEDFTTPGISLFLALPAEVEALKALDTLLRVARDISEQLGGELKDENRSVFTAQTAEHYRQRVMEFQRRKALAQAQA